MTESFERVEIALALVRVSGTTGDRNRQESALEEAVAGARENDPQLLRALLLAGRFATQTGRHVKAQRQLETALTLAKKLKDQTRETDAILTLAELSREQSRWGEAKKNYNKALRLARADSNLTNEARALKGIGFVISDQGDPYESMKWIEQAIDVYRTLGNHWLTAHTQTGLMSALAEACAWDRVLATAAEAIPVLEAYGDRPNLAVARHNQALAFNALGESQQARQSLVQNTQVFESIRSRRALGVTHLVMGETAEHQGNSAEAISYYRKALESAEAVKSLDGIAAAQWSLGALFVKLEQPLDAIPLLESALASWIEQGNQWERNQTEAVLGLALLIVGKRARAEEFAANGWEYFQSRKPLSEKPQQWLWSLYRLLVGLNQSDRAQKMLNATYAELQRQAKNISDPNQRRSFFERVPENRAIVQAYDRIAGGPRVITVSLARADVPLGRVIRHDELVSVRWTLNAPDDESIADKAERRIHRLKRLLDEAEQQGAAPTDDDLAQALQVSRRTILRDMQSLTKPPTRKRKS
jgi:tetratricopeptide (TPR) repeat protein